MMKRIILILILIPVLFLSGSSIPETTVSNTSSIPDSITNSLPASTPDSFLPQETNEVGEPYNPDYTTWQEDVKAVMLGMQDLPDDYFDPIEESGNLQYFSYETKNYDKDMAEETKLAVVYLPYGYSPDQQYDILYLMHGYTGDIYSWLGSPEAPGEMKYVLDHLIQDQVITPMIVVCSTYYDNNKNEMTDNVDTGLLEPFGQELRNDLIPAIESTFSTYTNSVDEQGLQASRTHRAFGGFSMGGVTTLYCLMDDMDLFSCFLDLSGPIYWSNLVNTETGDWAGSYLKEKILEEGYTDQDFHLYLATGSKDEGYPLMDLMVESMLKENDLFHFGQPGQDGVNVTYSVGNDEYHDWHNCARTLYDILPMISAQMNGTETGENTQ